MKPKPFYYNLNRQTINPWLSSSSSSSSFAVASTWCLWLMAIEQQEKGQAPFAPTSFSVLSFFPSFRREENMSAGEETRCFEDLEELRFLTSHPHAMDKSGRRIIRIVGKYLPGLLSSSLFCPFGAF